MDRQAAMDLVDLEKWVSHSCRRGGTTEAIERLRRLRAEHPEVPVPDDVINLVNRHFGWVLRQTTSQDHYTGLRLIEELLLVTMYI